MSTDRSNIIVSPTGFGSRLNTAFMCDLNNPKVAYLLGYLWADGCVSKVSRGYSIRLCIQTGDYEALAEILDQVGWKPRHTLNGKYRTTSLGVCNKGYHSFLTDHDYHVKSYVAPTKILAALPDSVRHYWWRGFFDGDGTFYLRPNGATVSIAAPYDQDWSFFTSLCAQLDISGELSCQRRLTGDVSRAALRNKRGILVFCSYIYAGDTFGLERKRVKYEEYKNRLEQAQLNRKTRYRGVCRIRNAFEMKIRVKGRFIRERFYPTHEGEIMAARRYDELETLFRGNKAILNFND